MLSQWVGGKYNKHIQITIITLHCKSAKLEIKDMIEYM